MLAGNVSSSPLPGCLPRLNGIANRRQVAGELRLREDAGQPAWVWDICAIPATNPRGGLHLLPHCASMPARVLILFAHPALQKSRVHRVLADAVSGMPGVRFHDLYERYPDFFVDVKAEQELLVAHDVLIFQHPFYWYSAPALVKEWQDLVLQYGFAYGDGGTALRGKLTLSVLTTGGPEESYRAERAEHFTVRQLLAPFEQMARQCGMDYLPPCVFHGTDGLGEAGLAAVAEEYARLVAALRDGALDVGEARRCERLNSELDRLIVAGGVA